MHLRSSRLLFLYALLFSGCFLFFYTLFLRRRLLFLYALLLRDPGFVCALFELVTVCKFMRAVL